MVHHEGPEATQPSLQLAPIGVLPEEARQPQQSDGVLQAELLGLGPLGQGGPLRLGVGVAHLAPLHVGAVLAKEQIHLLAGFRVFAQGLGAIGLLLENQLGLVGIEIGRGDLLGQGGLEQLLAAVLGDPLGLQVGAEATDAHHAGEALELHRA